jgi:uroporphyrinogen-III synthase
MERARELGLDAVALPLFKVEPIAWDVPEAAGFDGLLLTSANAVRHGGENLRELRGLPVYAVGPATAEAARDAGFDVASTGDAGVERLLGSIETDLKLLHLAGEDRKEIGPAKQEIRVIPVYRARAIERVALNGLDGSVALIHSARAARRFAELVDGAGANKASIALAVISGDAADAAGRGWQRVEIAHAPSDEALLALAERLCNNTAAK